MVKGYPDWEIVTGSGIGGAVSISSSFSGSVNSGATANFDVLTVPSGRTAIVKGISISVPDDEFIHTLKLFPTSTSTIIIQTEFVRDGQWNFSGDEFSETTVIRVQIINNSDATLTFNGSIYYTQR